MTRWIGLLAVLALAACAAPGRDAAEALFEDYWDFRIEEDPLWATQIGDPRGSDRLPDQTAASWKRRGERCREFLERLAPLEAQAAGFERAANLAILRRQLENAVAIVEFAAHQMPINSDSGFHSDLAFLPSQQPLDNDADLEAYLARLAEVPRYFNEQIVLMREGLARGFTQPREVIAGALPSIRAHIVDDPRDSVFYAPLVDRSEELAERGRSVIEGSVVPAYRELERFMVEEYLPGARETPAASELPGGADYYAQQVRYYTTLELTPREIHERGLAEVARIRAEMEGVIADLGFDGSFGEFLTFLRNDPRFYAKTPDELLREAAWLAKRIDGRLPELIGTLPRQPYAVEPVPDHLAPNYTAGRYVPPAEGSTEPGIYWVNTHRLESRPLYNLAALTLHEAVPGHHLQGALAREQGEQPAFRRYEYISAYGEGWALYAERLGLEVGIYDDPYADFGRLTYEMWRACRLVVDTGIHAFGWTREQARDYLAAHTALSLHEIATETDRYISWPAQALSYKLGELKIRELRARAEEALGDGFDRRDFHDVLLSTGSVPLPLLERRVDEWIAEGAGS